uniref:Receptor kinase n=1 Tax=Avena sativa TaxID=4498 RepID=Q941N4_AVESA|nr:receptor kinase [Avena sativa]
MSKLLVIAILLLPLISHGRDLSTIWVWEDKDFFKYCPSSQCSQHGPEIRYPFCLASSNTSSCGCGSRSVRKLVCSGQDTILVHPVLGPYNVSAIDYRHSSMKLIPLVDPCMVLQKKLISSRSSSSSQVYDDNDYDEDYDEYHEFLDPSATLVYCSREFTPSAADRIAGPVSCLSNTTHFLYFVASDEVISLLPLDCKVIPVSDGGGGRTIAMYMYAPVSMLDLYPQSFKESAESILSFAKKTVYWNGYNCRQCELSGGRCAFSAQRLEPFCMPHGSRTKVIAATSSVAAFVVLLLTVATALSLSLRTRYNEEIHLKVEMFLKTYGTSKPTRYTFSEVKKIARRFKEKVGQGGFGSVYKGELPNRVPVAVKMLENATGEGEVFINEVATIGLIHHANIVRLLGFCSEGMRRALIYEFMPNESLEKYIFSQTRIFFRMFCQC